MKNFNYKIDWLAFSINEENDKSETGEKFRILEVLDYDLTDFEAINGRYFYNSALTLGNYVNIYYNDNLKELIKGTTNTITYVFTGQGCVDLYERIKGNWQSFFKALLNLNANITRLDIAFDDFVGLLKFPTILSKLDKGHYRSSKKSYNVVRSSDVNQNDKGLTIYVGSARNSSSKGNFYLRMYDKKAQYLEKHQNLPEEIEQAEFWQRYEISYTKKKAQQVVQNLVSGQSVDFVYKSSMRAIIEFLKPTKNEKGEVFQNKSDWTVCNWWNDFLKIDDKIKFDNPEYDIDLGGLLHWLQVYVMPNIKNLERIGLRFGFDIYKMMREYEIEEFSKKQERLFNNLNNQKINSNDSLAVAKAKKSKNNQIIREVERAFHRFKDGGY